MSIESFERIYQRASDRKGGTSTLESMLPRPLDKEDLAALPDDRYLAQFTKSIFQSGFVWKVVTSKWDAFEEVFWAFDIEKMLLIPDEMLEQKATDPRIIRNFNKVKTVRHNASMIREVSNVHGSFGQFISDWPEDDIVGLWLYLKQHGQRLGGNTGPYALRHLGKDTFLFSRDVEAYLRSQDIVSGGIHTKRSLSAAQSAFNQWRAESGRSQTELSRLISFSIGDNSVQAATS